MKRPLKIKLTHPDAIVPTRGTPQSAGWDLYALEDMEIPANSRRTIRTGIAFWIPDGHYGSIRSRSGLAARHCIDVCAGVVDADYRGEVKVVLMNAGQSKFKVNRGDRIAQMIIEREFTTSFPLMVVEELSLSERGFDGLGSTGR